MPGYICSLCGELASADLGGLIWHLRNRHAVLVGQMFMQPIKCGQNGCMRTFRYSPALVRHIRRKHIELDMQPDVDNNFMNAENNIDPIENDIGS